MNDTRHLECVPTEYRGIEFRSKSEAILARNFDLLGLLWMYEPKQFTQADLWRPDFWIIEKHAEGPAFTSAIVEYKPRDPTPVFRKRLEFRFNDIGRQMAFTRFYLIVANPFDPSVDQRTEEWRGGQWGTVCTGWHTQFLQ